MCMLIVQQSGGDTLSRNMLKRCWKDNQDGGGYMFATCGRVVIRKPFYTLREFLRQYRADHSKYGKRSAFVLHMRYATHGSLTEVNTHPHTVIPGRIALAHNGVLTTQIPIGEDISDTVAYARSLRQLSEHTLMSAGFRQYAERDIGQGNKIAILNAAGEVSVLNEAYGYWEGDVWYSNTGYRKPTRAPIPVQENDWLYPNGMLDGDDVEFWRDVLAYEYTNKR